MFFSESIGSIELNFHFELPLEFMSGGTTKMLSMPSLCKQSLNIFSEIKGHMNLIPLICSTENVGFTKSFSDNALTKLNCIYREV